MVKRDRSCSAAFLIASFLLASGALVAGMRSINHSLGFENRGKDAVTDVRIRYGEYEFPMSLLRDHMSPGAHRTEIRELPIPEMASISWISADGVKHLVRCPVKSLMKDKKRFRGFVFRFKDDVVEVDVLELPANSDWRKGFDQTQVYSSAQPGA